MKNSAHRFVPLLLLLGAAPLASQPAHPMTREQIEAIVRPLTDGEYVPAMVVGLIDAQGQRAFGFGRVTDQDATIPNGDTVFEIGSASKVFTSLLLADMIERGQGKLDDPVQKYLPESVHLNQKGDRPITLLDLSTHRSGLPRLPANLPVKDTIDPYASYSPEMLLKFLTDWKPAVAPGERAEYSNLGVGLLGYVLSRRAGTTYEQLLADRIIRPLKMSDTSTTRSDSQQHRLAQPHDIDGNPSHTWEFTDALAGAGAIRSTANDMLRFIEAQLTPPAGQLGDAINLTHHRQNKFDENNDIGLGWLMSRRGYVWHNGATGGYHSFVAFNADQRIGVVILANSTGGWSEIAGIQILAAMSGIESPPLPKLRQPIKLDAKQLDRFTGDYFTGLALLTIRRDGNRLLVRMIGQPEFGVFPDSPTTFFWKAVDAQVDFTFGDDPGGKAIRLVLHQNGQNTYGIRTPDSPTTKPASQPTISP